jgi:hypothetical protein
MPVVFDEVVGEIAPEPRSERSAEGDQPGGEGRQIRTLVRALARERWKRNRLRDR